MFSSKKQTCNTSLTLLKENVLDNRFAFVVCHSGSIEFIIPEINLRGREPTENLNDVISYLVNRYNVGEYEIV